MKLLVALGSASIAFLVSLVQLTAQAQAQAESLRVGVYQNPPKVLIDETGQPAGFWVKVLNQIAQTEDWSLEYVICEWERCLDALAAGELDLMVDVAYSETRDRRFDFNQEVVLASWSVVYSAPNTPLDSMLSLDGKRVAVLADSIQASVLAEQTIEFDIQPELVEVESFEAIFQLLESGRVDAGIVNNFIGRASEADYDIVRTNILLSPSRLHFAVPEGQNADVLAALDRNLRQLTSDASSVYYQAQSLWLNPEHGRRWNQVRHTLIDLLIYVPLIGMGVFALWNRALNREVKRRQLTEARFQALADNIPGIIYQYLLHQDGSEALLYASSGCYDVWGVEAEAAMSDISRLWDLIHPEDLQNLRAAIFRSARTLNPWNQEWRIKTPQGQEKWLQASAVPQAQENGDVIWDGFVFDVTERKAAEIALRKSENRFQKLADNVPGVLYGYRLRPDGTEKFTYISSGFEEVYGFPPDSALEDNNVVWQMVHPEDLERLRRSVQESYQTMQVWQVQYRVITPAGQLKWLQGIARPTLQPNGDVIWDGLVVDISDRKQFEDALKASEQRLRNMSANVPGAIFQYVLHPDGTDSINYMSAGAYDLWEISADEAQQNVQQLWNMVHPADREGMYASVMQSARTLEPWYWQWRIVTPSGKTKWLEAAGRPEARSNGDVVWDSLIMDVSDRKQVEIALQTSENRLNTLISNLPGYVYRVANNRDYTPDFVSQGILEITGYPPEAFMGDNVDVSCGSRIHAHDRQRVWNLVQRAIAQRQNYECEYRIITRSGETKWVWERGQGIFDADGQLSHLEGFVSDVSDRIKAEQQLKHDALHDSLTGLPNRNRLMHRLDLALKRTIQNPDFQFAVLFLDLDNFKVVNDSLGHLVGDELLINVAELLGRSIRDTDVAARLGGDEFVILAEEIQGIHEAVAIADRVLAELRSPFAVAQRHVYISASIGIVAGGGTHERAADLLRDADLAMYRAKRSGRAQYAIFDPNMHLQAMQRLHLEQDLRQALQKDEFVLYYQPIVALNTLQIQGFEALVRWQHPQRGLVSPLEFIPIAEETGLIVPLGQWILNTACLQLAQWQAQFPERTLKMSVNLSVQQLQTPLVSDLVEALSLSQIAADSLVLEITESMLVEHIEPIQTLLEEVRKMGIYLSIDDFGTGYSSLSYLGKLPVDTLKIDRAFVSPDAAEARNQVIAESIIALSNLLELGVIAEGIQSLEQLEWLKHLGCKLGQGYLFSAPVPADQATQLLHHNLSLQTPR